MPTPDAIREFTDRDLPDVVRLCGTALDLPEDAAEADAIVRRIRQRAERGGRTAGFVATHDGSVVGVALGSVAHRERPAGHVDLVAVDPARRRRGTGRALLLRLEAALTASGVAELWLSGNPPCYAWPGIDVRYTPALCLGAALGYRHERTAWNMTVDLADPASPALADTSAAEAELAGRGVTVRRATPDDLPALLAFTASGDFGSWGEEVTDSIGRADAGCHLAVRDGELLGFAAYGSSRPSWFGPMGTAPAARGLGIGGLLLRRCLRDQRAAGHRTAQIGWVGPVPFYADAAGARVERVFFRYRRPC